MYSHSVFLNYCSISHIIASEEMLIRFEIGLNFKLTRLPVRVQQCAAVYLNIWFVLKFLTINFLAATICSNGHMRDNMRVIIITITSSRTRCPACWEALMMYSPIISRLLLPGHGASYALIVRI